MAFEFKLPDVGEGVVEGEIVKWLVREGDSVEEDQPLVEVMTDKATVEIPSPVAGTIVGTFGKEGDVVEVGATLLAIETTVPEEEVPPQSPILTSPEPISEVPEQTQRATKGLGRVLATPAVRRLAREKAIDLASIEGSGPGGRITSEDVEKAARVEAPAAQMDAKATDSVSQTVEEVAYRGLRKKIGDHLLASKRFAPHYTYVEEVDVTQLVELRTEFLSRNRDASLTYLPFLIRAVVAGLKKHPLLNASLDEEKKVIHLKKTYNIGVAVATEDGLVVPVIKNADQKSILELSSELATLSERTKQGKVRLEELRDGTFTITSLGPLGGIMATPIINYPEVAVLGVHKITERPVVRENQLVIRQMMNLSLSLDHRVVDGIEGARFLHEIIPLLEKPGLLMLG